MAERVATLGEIREHWSMNDVLDAHDALDLQREADARARKEAEAKR